MEDELELWEARLQKAAEIGAQTALTRVGLGDKEAAKDVDDFRSAVGIWRDLKKEAARTFVRWLVMALIAALVFSVSPKLTYLLKGN